MRRTTFGVTLLVAGMLVSSSATTSRADQDNPHRKNGVNVIEATFGGTTVDIFADFCPVVTPGNVTIPVHDACQGQNNCDYTVDTAVLGDPDFGCWKSFEVTYQCAANRNATRTETIPAAPDGADNKTVHLTCPIE
jgi:hypothetical protein